MQDIIDKWSGEEMEKIWELQGQKLLDRPSKVWEL